MSTENAETITEVPTLSPEELDLELDLDLELNVLDYPLADNEPFPFPPLEDVEYSPTVEKKARWTRIARKAAATAFGLVTLFAQYVGDTNANMEQERQAELSIEVVAPALDENNSNRAILFFDGFNSNRAEHLSTKLGPGLQAQLDSEIWSTNFNNDLADRKDVFENVQKLIEERGITQLIVFGYSKGGINSTETGVDTVINSWTNVDANVMVSTPSSFDGLRNYQQSELQAGMLVSKIWRARYFTPLRFGGEVYFYRDRFTDLDFNGDFWHDTGNVFENIGDFFEVLGDVTDRFNNPNLTSMSFLIEQVDEIDKANFSNEFSKLVNQDLKQKPINVYLGTAAPGYDRVVNDKVSGEAICDAAQENEQVCIRKNVPGAIHSQYYKTVDEYNQAFAEIGEQLRQAIADEQAAVALKRSEFARSENR